MVSVEVSSEATPTFGAPSSGYQGEYDALADGERSSHRLTQYSVKMISLIGRLAGGFSTACLLIRTIAVA